MRKHKTFVSHSFPLMLPSSLLRFTPFSNKHSPRSLVFRLSAAILSRFKLCSEIFCQGFTLFNSLHRVGWLNSSHVKPGFHKVEKDQNTTITLIQFLSIFSDMLIQAVEVKPLQRSSFISSLLIQFQHTTMVLKKEKNFVTTTFNIHNIRIYVLSSISEHAKPCFYCLIHSEKKLP